MHKSMKCFELRLVDTWKDQISHEVKEMFKSAADDSSVFSGHGSLCIEHIKDNTRTDSVGECGHWHPWHETPGAVEEVLTCDTCSCHLCTQNTLLLFYLSRMSPACLVWSLRALAQDASGVTVLHCWWEISHCVNVIVIIVICHWFNCFWFVTGLCRKEGNCSLDMKYCKIIIFK